MKCASHCGWRCFEWWDILKRGTSSYYTFLSSTISNWLQSYSRRSAETLTCTSRKGLCTFSLFLDCHSPFHLSRDLSGEEILFFVLMNTKCAVSLGVLTMYGFTVRYPRYFPVHGRVSFSPSWSTGPLRPSVLLTKMYTYVVRGLVHAEAFRVSVSRDHKVRVQTFLYRILCCAGCTSDGLGLCYCKVLPSVVQLFGHSAGRLSFIFVAPTTLLLRLNWLYSFCSVVAVHSAVRRILPLSHRFRTNSHNAITLVPAAH